MKKKGTLYRKFNLQNVVFWLFVLLFSNQLIGDDYITINKKNVIHKFVRFDQPTDHFTQNVFWNWENETFEVFDKLKDNQGIAIDLGAWIGTTSIWLSHNFYHVIAVEPDITSQKCLRANLIASDCSNVSICDQPVSNKNQPVIFGPLGRILNESISSIKTNTNNENDYTINSITFKNLIEDYFYSNDQLNSRKISFIKCDIEGGEEQILEDVLQFAYYNQIPVYMSFHLSWWKSKNINDFDDLFHYFETNCPTANICEFIRKNPFASILFQPKNNEPLLN